MRKTDVLFVVGGVLVGVVGTVGLMSKMHRGTPVAPPIPEASATGPKAVAEKKIVLSAEAKETAGIQVEPARMRVAGERLAAPGTVEVGAETSARMTPPVSGKVARILVHLGDTVGIGQPIITLDSFDVAQAEAVVKQAAAAIRQARAAQRTAAAETAQAEAGVRQAQAERDQARTKKQSAETALDRQKEFAAAGAFSQAPLQTAQNELSEAQAELLKAQTDLQAHTVVLQRAERLFKVDIISKADLERTQLEQNQERTQVARTKSRADIAKQALDREQNVHRGGLLSRQAVQPAEAEVRAAQGEVQRADQSVFRATQDVRKAQMGEAAALTSLQGAMTTLAAAQANVTALIGGGRKEGNGLLTLYAPLGGVIAELHATLGEAVERSTPLIVIENLRTVIVTASVAEKEVARIRIGQGCEVTVPAYPGRIFSGVVQSIAGHVDEKTRSFPVRCLFQNPGGRLKPEMFANVDMGVGAKTNALFVPLSALDEDGADHYVYVEEEGGYERRKVDVGPKTEKFVEIRSGVKSGEKLVTQGVFVLKSESKKGELKGDGD